MFAYYSVTPLNFIATVNLSEWSVRLNRRLTYKPCSASVNSWRPWNQTIKHQLTQYSNWTRSNRIGTSLSLSRCVALSGWFFCSLFVFRSASGYNTDEQIGYGHQNWYAWLVELFTLWICNICNMRTSVGTSIDRLFLIFHLLFDVWQKFANKKKIVRILSGCWTRSYSNETLSDYYLFEEHEKFNGPRFWRLAYIHQCVCVCGGMWITIDFAKKRNNLSLQYRQTDVVNKQTNRVLDSFRLPDPAGSKSTICQ